jgi:hypothetical protein
MLVLASPVFPNSYMVPSELSFITQLTYLADPILINLMGVFLCGIIIIGGLAGRFLVKNVEFIKFIKNNFKIFILTIISLGIFLIFLYIIEQTLLKPSLNYYRFSSHLQESWLSIKFSSHKEVADSCPSGFVLRQAMLLWIGIFFYRRIRFIPIERNYEIPVIIDFKLVSATTAALTGIFIPILIFFSRDIHLWIYVAIAACCLIGICNIMVNESFSENREKGKNS